MCLPGFTGWMPKGFLNPGREIPVKAGLSALWRRGDVRIWTGGARVYTKERTRRRNRNCFSKLTWSEGRQHAGGVQAFVPSKHFCSPWRVPDTLLHTLRKEYPFFKARSVSGEAHRLTWWGTWTPPIPRPSQLSPTVRNDNVASCQSKPHLTPQAVYQHCLSHIKPLNVKRKGKNSACKINHLNTGTWYHRTPGHATQSGEQPGWHRLSHRECTTSVPMVASHLNSGAGGSLQDTGNRLQGCFLTFSSPGVTFWLPPIPWWGDTLLEVLTLFTGQLLTSSWALGL